MTRIVDIVNFNADASCLPGRDWLKILDGGRDSPMCRWLEVYVELGRRMVLGFTGATVADLLAFNPEAIGVVNDHPEIFESVIRPFAHDVALLRTRPGFEFNVRTGRLVIERTFRRVVPFFLPAEFMLTSSQVGQLASLGLRGTFVNPARFKEEIRSRIPELPYRVEGLFRSRSDCIPIRGELTDAYLKSVQSWECLAWNQALEEQGVDPVFTWRDGESCFLIPRGLERERAWLGGESSRIERCFLGDAVGEVAFPEIPPDDVWTYRSYPVHSFTDWIKEFRMLGFLGRLSESEKRLDRMSLGDRVLWLQAINSDVLSAVEKRSPTVTLRTAPPGDPGAREELWTFMRSERGFEGEEFLEMLESSEDLASFLDRSREDRSPHLRKLEARWALLRELLP